MRKLICFLFGCRYEVVYSFVNKIEGYPYSITSGLICECCGKTRTECWTV